MSGAPQEEYEDDVIMFDHSGEGSDAENDEIYVHEEVIILSGNEAQEKVEQEASQEGEVMEL